QESADVKSTYWLSTALVDSALTGLTAVELRDQLQRHRIQTRRLWQPMHQSPAHRGCQSILTGVADRLFETALSFPSSPNLTPDSLERIHETLRQLLPVRARSAA
ncbi:MAG: DegT/DnrJ/EryC1/StrS family aminotransferase, partial [Planctomycetaceae bacterium]|nr:DegT/DnrJ/EryC1/StrS family aminotransferase [Planctomycetaceae bacterium]